MKNPLFKFLGNAVFALLFTFLLCSTIYGHCEIPCGIYDDSLRVAMIKEHINTVEKSMKQINLLYKNGII